MPDLNFFLSKPEGNHGESPLIKEIGKILSFIGVQYTLGRRGSYPYGLLIHFTLIKITFIVVVSDMIQTVFLLHFLDRVLGFLKRLRSRLRGKRDDSSKPENRTRERFKRYGPIGVFLVATLPYAGGALSGSILACSLKMDKRRAFLLITAGCIIGSIIFHLGFTGILALVHSGRQ